ncbi:unnamed protein product [Rhizophagus irregularis]|nr:unnamed protein product [Rhizophagus irregularis]
MNESYGVVRELSGKYDGGIDLIRAIFSLPKLIYIIFKHFIPKCLLQKMTIKFPTLNCLLLPHTSAKE